jgi:hypothetical protein
MKFKIRTGWVALALLMLALCAPAFPEAKKLYKLDDIAAAATASSIDYAKARNAAAAAAAAVPARIQAKSSTLTSSYSSGGTADGFSLSAAVPLVDQVGLSASFSDDLSSCVSATLSPLSHSDTRSQALISYAKALAAVDEQGRSAGRAAIKAALAWMSKSRLLATQAKTTVLKEDAYNAAKASNAVDSTTTTLDDLVAALQDWSDARTGLVTAQAAARKAETELYAAIGSSRAEADIESLGIEGLSAGLSALKDDLATAAGSGPAQSYSAKTASLEVESGRSRLGSIWAFEPELAISAGVAVPAAGSPSPAASVKLTISLDDLKGEKRAEARADLDVAMKTLALQKSSDANAYDQALSAVQAARLNSEGRKLARDQAAELAEVADFSYKSGSYSAIENETAALSLAAAEDAYYQALADEYSAWLDLGALAGK